MRLIILIISDEDDAEDTSDVVSKQFQVIMLKMQKHIEPFRFVPV